MTTSRIWVYASLLLAGSALANCKAFETKEGSPCKRKFDTLCQGDKGALVCDGSKRVALVCRGPQGCHYPGPSCDNTLAKEGDACLVSNDATCADDKKSRLSCVGGTWKTKTSCNGAKGCTITGDQVSCDTTLANPGEACEHNDSHACSVDKTAHTRCNGSKVELVNYCRGPKGCTVDGQNIGCDTTLAVIGEPCAKENDYSCASDGRSIVKCKARKYVNDEVCKKGKSCHVVNSQVSCS